MSAFLASRSNWIVVAGVALMAYLLLFRWTSSSQLERQQAAVISAIEDNRWSRAGGKVSERYKDRWGWSKDDLGRIFQDLRNQFLVLGIELQNPEWDIAGRRATFKAQLRLRGTPLGLGASIESRVNREAEPMFFYWEKESWLPWSWRLVRLNHAEVEFPDSYTPGDLLRAREGAYSF